MEQGGRGWQIADGRGWERVGR